MSVRRWSATAAVDHFFSPAPQQGMVACRILFGALLFFSYLGKAPWLSILYGPTGMGGSDLALRVPSAAFGRPLDAPFRWLAASDSLLLVQGAWAVLLVASLCFMLGYRTRVAGTIALFLHASFIARNQYAYYGWAWMSKAFLLYVILAPSGHWVSIDAWRRDARGGPEAPSSWQGVGWPLRLLRVHVSAMYAVTGLARLEDYGWRNGEMVFTAVTDSRFGRLDVDWHPFVWLLEPMSYVAFVAEPLAPLLLWIPGIGTAWAVLLILLHAGLELLANVGWWQWLMMSALLVFLPTGWLAPTLDRIDTVGRRIFGG